MGLRGAEEECRRGSLERRRWDNICALQAAPWQVLSDHCDTQAALKLAQYIRILGGGFGGVILGRMLNGFF